MNILAYPLAAFIMSSSFANAANNDLDLFEGDKKLACEAILCLSTSDRPVECEPSIQKYFSIHHKKPSKTISARKDFLKQCPESNDSKEMVDLVDTIANAAHRCSADILNKRTKTITVQRCTNNVPTNATKNGAYINKSPKNTDCETVRIRVIDNTMPSYCKAYMEHGYTDIKKLKYVGNMKDGTGRWVTE